ncbi:MerR family transcriptional regulator [Thermopetrobacter sp. TC1]|uniref:MerR family transcriptional regulator n=1 Tax=Thermopetrobacter sp. TC1 TaxID=1495045 RepID=UPI00056F3764|nr:MerR family transcriptional regulator [Thermopetrobacter sp. TC1]
MEDKAPEAFRTISEVAELLDVPQHVLRFWETRFSQIRPMKRAGGRRYYRPEDVDLLRGIRALLYGEGYTIKGVQKILREKGVKHVIAVGRGEARPEIAPVGEARAILPKAARDVIERREVPPQEQAEEPVKKQPVEERSSISVTAAASAMELEDLKLALTDLEAARRMLLRTLEGF